MDTIWIKTEPDLDDVYHTVLELGDDDIVPLDADAAYRWAREVLSSVARADYDAAVVKQAESLGMPREGIGMLVQELRDGRAGDLPLSATGLRLIPGVSHRTGKGFLILEHKGEQVGQWELEEARTHAMHVLEAFEVAQLDTGYLRTLTKYFGLGSDRARAVVAKLVDYRD